MVTDNVKKFWEEVSLGRRWRDYILPNRTAEQFWEEGQREAEHISLHIEDASFVIDYGCGIGRITFPMQKYCKNIFGLDVCENYINIGNLCQPQNKILMLRSDFKHKNIASFVYSISVLQHNNLQNRIAIMQDIYNLLRPGAMCWINFPVKGEIYRETNFVHTFTPDEVMELASKFSIVRIYKGNLVGYADRKPVTNNEIFLLAIK